MKSKGKFPEKTTGVVAATFTPFGDDQQIDTAIIKPYAEWLSRGEITGAFINGTTGEGASMTASERMQIAEAWMEAKQKDLRIFVHVGHTALPVAKQLASHAEKIGADAVACIAPFFFKPRNIGELAEWCAEVAGTAPALPFYYYHIPSLTGVNLKMVDLLTAAGKRIPNFAGLKFTYEDLEDYVACLDFEDGRYDILFGRDEILLKALKLGGKGAVGTTYNFTGPIYQRMIAAYHNGELQLAQELQGRATQLIDVCIKGEWHPIAAFKWIMSGMGLDCGPTRLPIPNLTPEQISLLEIRLKPFRETEVLVPSPQD